MKKTTINKPGINSLLRVYKDGSFTEKGKDILIKILFNHILGEEAFSKEVLFDPPQDKIKISHNNHKSYSRD